MQAIDQLRTRHFLFTLGVADIQPCVDWAIQRLQQDQEGDDLDIVLLAAATSEDEALPLAQRILARYLSPEPWDEQLTAGRYIAALWPRYLSGALSIASLDDTLSRIDNGLGHPEWLVMLGRNCEYAIDVDVFRVPFEQEFEYIATLWRQADSLDDFLRRYSREVSNRHDVKYS